MSDKSLRDALEKLAGELEYDVTGAPAKIRAVLAAHPAESTPDRQPSDAAVEAAAKAACEAAYPPNPSGRVKVHDSWEEIEEWERDAWRATARAALVAAYRVDAPRPTLDREAALRAIETAAEPEGSDNIMGRKYVENWADVFADAVMEMARELPTEDTLTEWLRGVELSGGQLTDAYVTEDEARTLAAAVLAKLNGAGS